MNRYTIQSWIALLICVAALVPVAFVFAWNCRSVQPAAAAEVVIVHPHSEAATQASLASELPATQPTQTGVAVKPAAEANSPSPADQVAVAHTGVLQPALLTEIAQITSDQNFERSEIVGGAFANQPFQDFCNNGVLIGLRIGLGKFFTSDVVKYVQPIYLTAAGKKYGEGFGGGTNEMWEVIAPAGCAVSGISIRGGGGLDAIKLEFAPLNGIHLDINETHITRRIGGFGGSESHLGGDGTPIIGIRGQISAKDNYIGLGLIFVRPTDSARAQHRWQ